MRYKYVAADIQDTHVFSVCSDSVFVLGLYVRNCASVGTKEVSIVGTKEVKTLFRLEGLVQSF